MVPLLISFLTQYLGLDDERAGLVFGTYVGLVTLLMFPGGWLCDRIGPRQALRLALLLLGLGRSLLTLSPGLGPGTAYLALTLMATGTGIVQPCVYSGVKAYSQSKNASLDYGWLYSIMNLGSVLWFLLSPTIRHHGGTIGVYAALTGLTWLNALLQGFGFRQDPPPSDPVNPEPSSSASSLVKNSRFLVFIWLLVPVRNLLAHFNCSLPTTVERVYPWFYPHLEYLFALNNLLLFLATPPLTRATQPYPILRVIQGGSLVSAVAVGFLMLSPETWALLAFVTFFSLGEAVWQSRFYEFVAQQAPSGGVGQAMSWANFPWFLTKTLAGTYSGWMLKHYLPNHSWTLWGIYLLVALLTPLLLRLAESWLEQGFTHPQPKRVR